MTSTTFFIIFIPILAIILLAVNLILAPHNPYQEKDSPFECGFHSFSGQNRTQFSISFFIFALLFLLFDLEIVLIYPYSVSGYNNGIYGLAIMIVFFLVLTGGFVFELGKNALSIESRQTSTYENEDIPESHAFISFLWESILINSRVSGFSYFDALIIRFVLWFYKNETQYKILLIQVVYGSIVALYYALDHFDITVTFGYFDIILLSLNFLYEMDLLFCKVYGEEFNFDNIMDEYDNDHIFPINIDEMEMLLFDESDNDNISSTDESNKKPRNK